MFTENWYGEIESTFINSKKMLQVKVCGAEKENQRNMKLFKHHNCTTSIANSGQSNGKMEITLYNSK